MRRRRGGDANQSILVKHNQWKNLKNRSMLVEQNQRKNLKKNWVGGSWEEIYYGISPKNRLDQIQSKHTR